MTRVTKVLSGLLAAAVFAVSLFSFCALGGDEPRRLTSTVPPFEAGQATMEQLRDFFPHGMYWNHVVGDEEEAYSVTDTPCSPYSDEEGLHDTQAGVTCNYFEIPGTVWGGWQCCGYARLLTYSYFGSSFEHWDTAETLATVKAGDVLYLWNGGPHYIWILSLTDNGDGTAAITYADCNGTGKRSHCQIQWDALGTLDLKNNTLKNELLGDWALQKLYCSPESKTTFTTTTQSATTAATAATRAMATATLVVRYNLLGGDVADDCYAVSEAGELLWRQTGALKTDVFDENGWFDKTLLAAGPTVLTRDGYWFGGWTTDKGECQAMVSQAAAYPVTAEKAAIWFEKEWEKKTTVRLKTAFEHGVRQVTLYAVWIPAEKEETE